MSDMYNNPVQRGFFPDPSVVRVGDDYYMTNSVFPCNCNQPFQGYDSLACNWTCNYRFRRT